MQLNEVLIWSSLRSDARPCVVLKWCETRHWWESCRQFTVRVHKIQYEAMSSKAKLRHRVLESEHNERSRDWILIRIRYNQLNEKHQELCSSSLLIPSQLRTQLTYKLRQIRGWSSTWVPTWTHRKPISSVMVSFWGAKSPSFRICIPASGTISFAVILGAILISRLVMAPLMAFKVIASRRLLVLLVLITVVPWWSWRYFCCSLKEAVPPAV